MLVLPLPITSVAALTNPGEPLDVPSLSFQFPAARLFTPSVRYSDAIVQLLRARPR